MVSVSLDSNSSKINSISDCLLAGSDSEDEGCNWLDPGDSESPACSLRTPELKNLEGFVLVFNRFFPGFVGLFATHGFKLLWC